MIQLFIIALMMSSLTFSSEEDQSFKFQIAEMFLNWDGRSYIGMKNENEKLVKEVELLKKENLELKAESDTWKKSHRLEKEKLNEQLTWNGPKPQLFKIFNKESHGVIRIDSCNSDLAIEDANIRPSKLYLVSKSGIGEMDYLKTVEVENEVCNTITSRTLWEFEVNRNLLEENMFVIDTSNLKYTAFGEKDFRPAKIDNAEGCQTFIKSDLRYEKCSNYEVLTLKGKELLNLSAVYSMPNIKVLGEVVINGRKFLHIEYETKIGVNILLKSEDGVELSSRGCSESAIC